MASSASSSATSARTPSGGLRGKGHQGAYLRIPFEVEADWVARRTLAGEREAAAHNQRAPLA